MNDNQNQPTEYDAVLGGVSPPPSQGVILGGIQGVKHRLNSLSLEARIAALSEALNYGNEGLDLVTAALKDKFRKVRHAAMQLLKERREEKAKLAVQNYKFCSNFRFERLNELPLPYGHATTFANRKVIEVDSFPQIIDPAKTAYALRVSNDWSQEAHQSNITILDKFQSLLKARRAKEIEALVFGFCGYTLYPIVDILVSARENFKNLKAVFFGDIDNSECDSRSIILNDISKVLIAYPNLEVLKIRCSEYGLDKLAFEPLHHNKLKALIIESDKLHPEVLNEICALELPALEYLELWLGEETDHFENLPLKPVMPIISGQRFSKLKYLGLRHSNDSVYIALALIESSLIEQLIELDISMGNLEDDGAEFLLNCPAVHQLDTLNISLNCLSNDMVTRLKQLDIEIICDNFTYRGERYCTASE
ncbi:hypothetical protein [Chlorogloea sp. CCALA 695]|uniref:hypothetical protein n=1 Tax=Chlorogloea sp. CCALA 695 TaxID=2107693 RepID=UPI000D04C62D|nr:hypothetical protein [Chlorogloea sp. CCALA 695]PSB34028.1 hypothetical protein C7B70_05190 [Chlorogloea sp. CCALA 695]